MRPCMMRVFGHSFVLSDKPPSFGRISENVVLARTMVCYQWVFVSWIELNYLAMTTTTISTPRTIRDLIPRSNGSNANVLSIATDVVLVVGFALLTAILAQVSFKLSFTPVPITGQTLAVLLAGASLGSVRGASSQILYLVMGLFMPFYADGAQGWNILKGYTGGYIFGFIVASALIGYLAEKKNDRKVFSAIGSFLVGSLVIYFFGALWLAHTLNISVASGPDSALAVGVIPFLFGDILKATVAGLVLPGSWKLIEYFKNGNKQS